MDVTRIVEADPRTVQDLFRKISNAASDHRMPLIQVADALSRRMGR